MCDVTYGRPFNRQHWHLQSVRATLRQEVANEGEVDAVGDEGVGQVAEENDHDGKGASAADGCYDGDAYQHFVLTTWKTKLKRKKSLFLLFFPIDERTKSQWSNSVVLNRGAAAPLSALKKLQGCRQFINVMLIFLSIVGRGAEILLFNQKGCRETRKVWKHWSN